MFVYKYEVSQVLESLQAEWCTIFFTDVDMHSAFIVHVIVEMVGTQGGGDFGDLFGGFFKR